jgi:4-amino-4-deoxy-L-arabinose transferase-like glycosyltransferase
MRRLSTGKRAALVAAAILLVLGLLQWFGVLRTTDAPLDPRWRGPAYETH